MSLNNLSLLTYTHSKCLDIHKPYFGRLKKYFPELINNYITCDVNIKEAICIVYENTETYASHMLKALDKVHTDYVIYSQEDYILFDYVNSKNIEEYIKIMDKDPNIGFIRLIQSGLGTVFEKYTDDLIVIDPNSLYYFSTQATIWKKNTLKEMFKLSQCKSIFDEPINSPYLKQLQIQGLCPTKRGKQVGGHYDSYDYPYIATAKVKGQWNFQEYPDELNQLFKEYNLS